MTKFKCGKSDKNYQWIISKPHAHLQTMQKKKKTSVKFQNRQNTVGGVEHTKYL